MKIVTIEQMRRLEEASASAGVSTDTLMENAGLAVAREVRKSLGGVAGSRILVLVGPGNNGGDGLVAARHLRRWGAEVTAYMLLRHMEEDPKFQATLEAGVSSLSTSQDPDLSVLERELANSRVVIDAVLGTGRARPLEGAISEAMLRLSAAKSRRPSMTIVSLDLPTGMDADTGRVDPACPQADITLTFGYPKVGHFRSPGAERRGNLEVLDIGVPGCLAHDINLELLTSEWVGSKLPTRPPDGHKGTFGHVLVIAGSRNYVGAAYLAAQGAARVGPGLVTLASPQSVYPILASKLTEVIHLPLPDDEHGRFNPDGAEMVMENLHHYSALLVGCGFGRSEGLAEFLRRLLIEGPQLSLPVVIDADGLNNLSTIEDWWHGLKFPAVLTPHPGEMSTLTGVTIPDIQSGRTEAALEWASRWNTMVVLKGAYTVVASPGGACRVSPFANPALASGGTGDVLTGVIAGLMAQGLSLEDASCCGVYLHGAAGEMVRDEMGNTGTLAGDLLTVLPRTIETVRKV